MSWDDQSVRHRPLSGNPDRGGIELTAKRALVAANWQQAFNNGSTEVWQTEINGLIGKARKEISQSGDIRFPDGTFGRVYWEAFPADENLSGMWNSNSEGRSQAFSLEEAQADFEQWAATADVLDGLAPEWDDRWSSRRAAAPISPNSQKPEIGDESDSPTVPVEKPEEDGTLKAQLRRAMDDMGRRSQELAGQFMDWCNDNGVANSEKWARFFGDIHGLDPDEVDRLIRDGVGGGINPDDPYAHTSRRRTAGYQESNWRDYPSGDGPSDSYSDQCYADYEDAMAPWENPRARITGEESYGDIEYTVEVTDGSGAVVLSEQAYDLAEAKARADKQLQKLYKGEGKLDKDQGRFFTTPGKGKLFSNRTAMSMWDQIEEPRHKVAGWDWDSKLEGYVAEGAADFACICGSNVEAPGQVVCACGKMWNSYTVASTDGLRFVCREVPVREGVILAGRERTADVVRDPDYWGMPEGTPITPGMKPKGDGGGGGSGKGEAGGGDDAAAREEPSPATPEPAPSPKAAKPPLTEAELEQRVAEIQTKVDEAKAAGKETNVAYAVNGKVDTYNDQRRTEQRRLLGKAWAKFGANVPREGKALMSGGLGGAGKTTVLKSEQVGVDIGQYLQVNADDIKELMVEQGMVPEVEGLAPMEMAALIHEESSYLATQLAYQAYENGTNIIWDITMASPGSVQKRINDMTESGYNEISAVFVDIPVEKSVERAIGRYKRGLENFRNGKGPGGRYVPPKIIRKNAPEGDEYNSRNRETFESLRDQFDNSVVYDNSVDGGTPRKVDGFGRWARRVMRRLWL